MSRYEFKGRNVLITGAASGIGAELSKCFAAEGAHCILCSHPSEAGKLIAFSEELREAYSVDTWSFVEDLGEKEGPERLYNEVKERIPVVDVLVNNAGRIVYGDFHEADLILQLGIVRINIEALMSLMHLFLQDMTARGEGLVLNVSSVSAFQPTVHHAVYGASKAFVQSLSEAANEEVKRRGVRVCTLNPSYTDTPMIKGNGFPERLRWYSVSGIADPAVIAQEGVRALKNGKSIHIPGIRNKIIHSLLPRLSSRKITNWMSYHALKKSR